MALGQINQFKTLCSTRPSSSCSIFMQNTSKICFSKLLVQRPSFHFPASTPPRIFAFPFHLNFPHQTSAFYWLTCVTRTVLMLRFGWQSFNQTVLRRRRKGLRKKQNSDQTSTGNIEFKLLFLSALAIKLKSCWLSQLIYCYDVHSPLPVPASTLETS